MLSTENLILSASPIYHEGSNIWLAQVPLRYFSPIYHEGFDIWLAQVPQRYFGIVEMHYLDQVMR
jgi:hypothetical protein